MLTVPGYGRLPSPIMAVGEAPGRKESLARRPFVGPSGELQAQRFQRSGIHLRDVYLTNLVKEYRDGNPDPTPPQIEMWGGVLLSEIEECNPKLIIAVGRFAARYFLGESCDLNVCHGMPHRWIEPLTAIERTVIPIYHPAWGLRDYTRRPWIFDDYNECGYIWSLIKSNRIAIPYREDEYIGLEDYRDCSADEFIHLMESELFDICGLDTEGIPGHEESIQISTRPGNGYVLRTDQVNFYHAIKVLSDLIYSRNVLVCMHQASTPEWTAYDLVMCLGMKLDLYKAQIHDTMPSAYLRRTEPQGLKFLANRYCGMAMEPYEDLVEDITRQRRLEYLNRAYALSSSWSKPEPRKIRENDGRIRLYKPQPISQLIKTLIRDIESDKRNNKDEPVNIRDRWNKFDRMQRLECERELGLLPFGSLRDLKDQKKATDYAGRDSDGALRVGIYQISNNPRWGDKSKGGLVNLARTANKNLPTFSRMQLSGMPVSRSYFESLSLEMEKEIEEIRSEISNKYFLGQPFNPKSPKHSAKLLKIRGLEPGRYTPTGQPSTDEKSIGHYQYTDAAFALLFECRKRRHNKEVYCDDILERVPEGEDFYILHPNYRSTKVHTRRLSSTGPNILAIPIRTPLGRKIRQGYIAPKGKIFMSADYSGFELRCLAHESRDQLLVDVFLTGRSPHHETATRLFRVAKSDITVFQKTVSKNINFGTVYGIGPSGLYDQFRMNGILDYSLVQCSKFLDDYFEIYPGVYQYRQRVISQCREDEIVFDHWGMPRPLPGINERDRSIRGDEERAAVSHKIQGLATGMMHNALSWLIPRIEALQDSDYGIDWSLLLHDELIFLCDDNDDVKEELSDLVLRAFKSHSGIDLIVPIEAEVHFGYNWADLK